MPGFLNDVADGILRWPFNCVSANRSPCRPSDQFYIKGIGSEGTHLSCFILAACSSDMPLRRRLRELASDILGPGFSSGVR